MEKPINQSVLEFKGSGCDKREKQLKLCKCSINLCTQAVCLIDLQAEVSRFRCPIFHCLFSQLSSISFVSMFYSYPLVIDLNLQLFKKTFQIRFLII